MRVKTMTRGDLKTLALLGLFLLAACAGTPSMLNADGSPNGQAIYEHRCSQCHRRKDPTLWDDEDWERLIRIYAPRAHLTPAWRDAVLAWLKQANDELPAAR